MLNLKVGQKVYLCTYRIPPREALVEAVVYGDHAYVSFLTTSGKPAIGKFWLSNGANNGNNAYWIQLYCPEGNADFWVSVSENKYKKTPFKRLNGVFVLYIQLLKSFWATFALKNPMWLQHCQRCSTR